MKHRATEGTSETRVTLLAGEARFEPWRLPFMPGSRAGCAVIILDTKGHGERPLFRDTGDSRVSVGPYLRPGVGLVVSQQLVIRTEIAIGLQTRPIVIDYAGRDAARWGTPWFGSSVTIEARVSRK